MKKFIMAISVVLLLAGCGVGNYSLSSGKADEGALSFVSSEASEIQVTVDGTVYGLSCVKEQAYRTDRNIKQTAKNTIRLAPGTHEVEVAREGRTVLVKKVYISASEHKIIEL